MAGKYYQYGVDTVCEDGSSGCATGACAQDLTDLGATISEATTSALYYLGECEYSKVFVSIDEVCGTCFGTGVVKAKRGNKKCAACKGVDSCKQIVQYEVKPNNGFSDVIVTTVSKMQAAKAA